MKKILRATIFILTAFLVMSSYVSAEIPRIITYQGVLNDDGNPVDGIHSVEFKLYDALSGGNLMWSETQNVTFTEGFFNVRLGVLNPFNDLQFDVAYWLSIGIDGGQEMAPRTPLTSAGFSFRSLYVDQLSEQNIHQFWELMQTMPDADGDGYDKISEGGDDCDDMNPFINPGAEELCDGIDNNCDGQVDNGAESDCLPLPPNVTAVGCAAGECLILECASGWRDDNGVYVDGCEYDCSGEIEICDGIDNNCNGVVDEGCECIDGQTEPCYTGPPETEGIGQCQSGIRTCDGGVWGPCIGEQLPDPEVCDGVDNDCDGAVDNNVPPAGPEVCGVPPEGVCNWITAICVDGVYQCIFPPEYEEIEVTCDGLDNDCDGEIDEGCN